METKTCSKCNLSKPLTNFYPRSGQCKPCQIAKAQIWAQNHRHLTKKYLQKFKDRNLEKYRTQQREYFERNRELVRERRKLWVQNNREKYRNYRRKNINYRISENLRSRIRLALRGITKSKHTMDLIGCTAAFLRTYLEKQFQEGMNWENYGKWHIDHIKACAKFNLTDPKQQAQCFHYSNLQPLWARDNSEKGAN
jgi:hypothetical protein